MQPFVSNEFFYDLDEEKYNRNRLDVGVDFTKTKYGRFSIYYRHATELQDDDEWTASYSIIGKFTYYF